MIAVKIEEEQIGREMCNGTKLIIDEIVVELDWYTDEWWISVDVGAVESLYSAMCDCQALHPDENDSLSAGSFPVTRQFIVHLLLLPIFYFHVILLY